MSILDKPLKPSSDLDNPPQTHTDLDENLATDIVRVHKDDFDRLDCLVEDPHPHKLSSINVSLDSHFKRSTKQHLSHSDIKPAKTDSQHDALTVDNQPKQSSDDHQSFMLVMEDQEEPF